LIQNGLVSEGFAPGTFPHFETFSAVTENVGRFKPSSIALKIATNRCNKAIFRIVGQSPAKHGGHPDEGQHITPANAPRIRQYSEDLCAMRGVGGDVVRINVDRNPFACLGGTVPSVLTRTGTGRSISI
jgi:hypothetical protein